MTIEPVYFLVLLAAWSATFGAALFWAVTSFFRSSQRRKIQKRLAISKKKPTIKRARRVKP